MRKNVRPRELNRGNRILYLSSMNEAGMGQGDLDKISVMGANLNECLFKFKPHSLLAEPYGLVNS